MNYSFMIKAALAYKLKGFRVVFSLFAISTFLLSCDKIKDPDGNSISGVTITAIKPTHGPFGTIDTIIGKGFDKIPAIDSVLINGKKLTFISSTPEQVIVEIPAMTGSGNVEIWYQGKLIRGPVFTYDSTLMVTTLAGSSDYGAIDGEGLNARFNQLQGIVVDHSGTIYVVDRNNNAIRKITPQGKVTTLAGSLSETGGYADGTGMAAQFSQPWALAMGPDGFLYVGDQVNYRIRKVSLSGVVTTYAGKLWYTGPLGGQIDGDTSVATFNSPAGITVDASNNVYVADYFNNKIRKITTGGIVSTYAGSDYYNAGHQDGPAGSSRFRYPHTVAADPSGNIFVIDGGNRMLRKISSAGIVSTLLGPYEPSITGDTELFSSTALAFDKKGNLFFSIPMGIMKMTANGEIIRYATGGSGGIDGPAQVATYLSIGGIAIDDSGNLYITDNNKVRKIHWY